MSALSQGCRAVLCMNFVNSVTLFIMIASIEPRIPSAYSTSFYTKAPAKLNLRLKITARKPDGYHELSMINVPIDLYDEVTLSFNNETEPALRISPASSQASACLGSGERNLALRAAKAFLSLNSMPANPVITLTKRIPIGAGLGGGSSDAAAVLRLMSAAFACFYPELEPVSEKDLLERALKLGADVPFFMHGVPSVVKGIGEEVFPVSLGSLIQTECMVLLPPIELSTAEMYSSFRQRYPVMKNRPDEVTTFMLGEPAPKPVSLSELVENDFQEIARDRSLLLRGLFDELQTLQPRLIASLTGSGCGLFVVPREGTGFSDRLRKELEGIAGNHGVALQEVRMLQRRPRVTRKGLPASI